MSSKPGNKSDSERRKRDAKTEKPKPNEELSEFHLVCKAFAGAEGKKDPRDDVINDLSAMGCICAEDPVITDPNKIFAGFAASEAFVTGSLKTQTNASTRTKSSDKPDTIQGVSALFPGISDIAQIPQLPPLPSPSIPFSRCGHSEPHLQLKAAAYAFGSPGPRSVAPALPWLGTDGIGVWKGESSGDPMAPLVGGALWARHVVNERDTSVMTGYRSLLGPFTQTEVEWDGRWVHEGAEAEGIIVYEESTGTYKKVGRPAK